MTESEGYVHSKVYTMLDDKSNVYRSCTRCIIQKAAHRLTQAANAKHHPRLPLYIPSTNLARSYVKNATADIGITLTYPIVNPT